MTFNKVASFQITCIIYPEAYVRQWKEFMFSDAELINMEGEAAYLFFCFLIGISGLC